jgi:DNA modification methylase
MNFQHCHKVAFVGLSYSFENFYQALRRVYRFGQTQTIKVLIVETEAEEGLRGVVERKIDDHEKMQDAMCKQMKDFQKMEGRKLNTNTKVNKHIADGWQAWHGDSCIGCKEMETDSVDFAIFSPPFSNLYIYSDSMNDMGNSADSDEFFTHFDFLIRELFRITVNGRLCAVHCKDLPAYKGRDGAAGLIDFPGEIIKHFSDCGWQYHSRVTIWKDPVTEMQRTKNHGLLHKQLCKDSSASRQGMADYLIVFRKWDGHDFPKPVRGKDGQCRFTTYIGEDGPKKTRSDRDMSIQVWQRYASPVWFDIKQQNVLQGSKHATSENDEKHICPLQLDVINRAIHLWTNKGDTVFSPFMGIGSEGYCAVKMKRKFIGIELKESYYNQAVKNIQRAYNESHERELF